MHGTLTLTQPLTPKPAFETDVPRSVLEFTEASVDAGFAAALVTLVDIRGGSARPIGAQMAVRSDGLFCGFVSGGCTEAAVASEALQALDVGQDRFLKLGQGSPFFDIVLPCGGGITLSIHLVRDIEPIRDVLRALADRRAAGLRYDPGSQRLSSASGHCSTGWTDDAFVTGYQPNARIVLCGRSLELTATARVAEAAGYEVVVTDGDIAHQIDENTAVAVLYHDLEREIPILCAALDAKPFYIGALGSHRTHERRCAALAELGYGAADIARIKAPIGIFPKARDAASLALSVVADIAAARSGG